ncbi:hypothetical protein [Sphingomonas sp. 35-24ZXX]|uniref:hypothetical protein n=1 Tax=Sphingomonas sp. 35-24ZXX TaxID=1545915 RepID=UPI00053BF839|nr:hypothetical protein [Sphingomonas sp. 35-24ZXX]
MQTHSASDPAQDRLTLARQQLRMQAGHLRSLARRVARDDLRREIGKMRHMAEVNALPCVSDLAYGLEHLLAHGWSRTMAAQYLDAMDEAIASDCGDGDMRAAMLASIAVRGVR